MSAPVQREDDDEQTFICNVCERSVPWSQGVKAQREAEYQERRRIERERRAALTPEARAAEDRVPSVVLLAAALGGSTGVHR